ncbi:MAG: peptide deformylase [Balneolales bacterium]|nr:peptide deformylase [Balneolales bacterium]
MSILPIVTYNDPVLREKSSPVKENTAEIQKLIDDMFETMYNGQGVGLAAPQIGVSLRLFVTDSDPFISDEDQETDFGPMVFVNPEIISKGQETSSFDEGCLSIPGLREPVTRPETIKIRFQDRNFEHQEMEISGWLSRIFQHEYDHIEGVLFIDYLGSFRKRLIRSKLQLVESGKAPAEYPLVPKKELIS